jgi:integrase
VKTLRKAIRHYLELRRGLGFKLVVDERHLRDFALFLEKRKTSRITTQLALEFATERRHNDRGSWAQRMGSVRAFARYWNGLDLTSEVPPAGLIRYPKKRARPRICTEDQIVRLLDVARNVPPTRTRGLRPWTVYMVLGLLAVSGMRVSEALNLKSADIDWEEGVLAIRNTKFGKSRLVPLHCSTLAVLDSYARRRDRFLGGSWRRGRPQRSSGLFFVSNRGTALSYYNLNWSFRRLLRQAGLATPEHPRTRIHDLRHRFAVETIRRWYRSDGEQIDRRMPALSTYLGHAAVESTYWYLTCTPELRAAASRRVEAYWKGVGHV